MTVKEIFLTTKKKIIIGFTICLVILISGGGISIFFINQEQEKQEKRNLNTITKLTGLNLKSDKTKRFRDFDYEIIRANEFYHNNLTKGFSVMYYDLPYTGKIITDQSQKNGSFFITIKASSTDPYWRGSTTPLKINVN